jgi:biuret amidohydrolase
VAALSIASSPYRFPHGGLFAERTALVLIDMQRDFLDGDGYLAAMGYDLADLRAAVPNAARLLDPEAHRAALCLMQVEAGIHGATADTAAIVAALDELAANRPESGSSGRRANYASATGG